jgi:hypothetical protein
VVSAAEREKRQLLRRLAEKKARLRELRKPPERNDEIGGLIQLLKWATPGDEYDAIQVSAQLLAGIIEALERVPKRRGRHDTIPVPGPLHALIIESLARVPKDNPYSSISAPLLALIIESSDRVIAGGSRPGSQRTIWGDPPNDALSGSGLPVSGILLAWIIEALERVPRRRGNQRAAIRGRALMLERGARALALARKRELMAEGMSAVDAEWEAAEEHVPTFLKFTGRKLAPDTVRRIMQGKRSKRRRKSRRQIAD